LPTIGVDFYTLAHKDFLPFLEDVLCIKVISATESNYWDFIYKERQLTLHYNIYVGVSIFSKSLTNATSLDNQIVLDLSKTLSDGIEKFNNPDKFVAKFLTQHLFSGDFVATHICGEI
jgi:hypothetical protein